MRFERYYGIYPVRKLEHKFICSKNKIVSQVSTPLQFDEKEIVLDSSFQKRKILNDMNKSYFDILKGLEEDYCLVDFIDERFNLVKLENTYITKSNELVNSGFLKEKSFIEGQYIKEDNGYYLEGRLQDEYMKMYFDRLLVYFKPQNIILHEAYMVNDYIDDEGRKRDFADYILKNNEKLNDMLHYMYSWVAAYLKKINIIDISSKYSADTGNKWGLGPMYYQTEYYLDAAEQINRFMRL